MRRSLVTGGAGFLGGHLVRRLRDAGDEVRVLDVAVPVDPVDGARYQRGSVTDPNAVRSALQGVERVFHLAGTPELWSADDAEAARVHVEGTRTVLEEAERAGAARIVHTSTAAILRDFGGRGDPRAASRDEPTLPDPEEVPDGYCRAKVRSEEAALDAARGGAPVVVVSPGAPLGPGDRGPTPPSRMLLGFLNGRFPAYMDGWLSVVDVRDVAGGHLIAAEEGRPGARYVLAGPDLRLGEFLHRLEGLTGLSMPRLRVPPLLARASARISELVADHLTGRSPDATLSGVRIALAPARTDLGSLGPEALGLNFRELEETLADAVRWFAEEGMLERKLAAPV